MSGVLSTLFSASKPPPDHEHNHKTTISNELLESAQADIAAVLQRLRTETNGLTAKEARARLKQYGPNEIAKEKKQISLDTVDLQCQESPRNPLIGPGTGLLPDR